MPTLVQARNNTTLEKGKTILRLDVRSTAEKKQLCPQRYSLPTQPDRSNFGRADKNVFVSPTTVLPCSYFSPVSRGMPLKVCYHLARWCFLLLDWFCGLKGSRLLSILQLNHPDRTRCIRAHIFSLFSGRKPKGVGTESLLLGRSVKPSLKNNRAFHLFLAPSTQACVLLTKAADSCV